MFPLTFSFYFSNRDEHERYENDLEMIEVENDERYWVYTIPSIEDGETKKRIKALEYDEDCSLRSVVISDTIEEIGREAFNFCRNLKDIKFGSGLKRIDREAFYGCDSLESIIFPESLESIEEKAFSSCDSLSSVRVGSALSYIGEGAFAYCESLENIYISSDNEFFSSIDGILYDEEGTKMVLYPPGRNDC